MASAITLWLSARLTLTKISYITQDYYGKHIRRNALYWQQSSLDEKLTKSYLSLQSQVQSHHLLLCLPYGPYLGQNDMRVLWSCSTVRMENFLSRCDKVSSNWTSLASLFPEEISQRKDSKVNPLILRSQIQPLRSVWSVRGAPFQFFNVEGVSRDPWVLKVIGRLTKLCNGLTQEGISLAYMKVGSGWAVELGHMAGISQSRQKLNHLLRFQLYVQGIA